MPMETKEMTVRRDARRGRKERLEMRADEGEGIVVPASALKFQRKRMPFVQQSSDGVRAQKF